MHRGRRRGRATHDGGSGGIGPGFVAEIRHKCRRVGVRPDPRGVGEGCGGAAHGHRCSQCGGAVEEVDRARVSSGQRRGQLDDGPRRLGTGGRRKTECGGCRVDQGEQLGPTVGRDGGAVHGDGRAGGVVADVSLPVGARGVARPERTGVGETDLNRVGITGRGVGDVGRQPGGDVCRAGRRHREIWRVGSHISGRARGQTRRWTERRHPGLGRPRPVAGHHTVLGVVEVDDGFGRATVGRGQRYRVGEGAIEIGPRSDLVAIGVVEEHVAIWGRGAGVRFPRWGRSRRGGHPRHHGRHHTERRHGRQRDRPDPPATHTHIQLPFPLFVPRNLISY